MKLLAAVVLFVLMAISLCQADALKPPKVYGAFSASFADSTLKPADYEVGANVVLGIRKSIDAVASGSYGFKTKASRASFGPRFTVSDTSNHNVSVGLGAEYQIVPEHSNLKNEWIGVAAIGIRPWPANRKVIVGAKITYGFESREPSVIAAVRRQIGGK